MISVLVHSGVVAVVAVAAGLLPLVRKWSNESLHVLFGFSAGVLSAAAFLTLIPEAFNSIGPVAGYYVLAGLLFLFIVERYAVAHPCDPLHHDFRPLGLVALLGFSLHNLTDGLALGAGALVPSLTTTVFIAVLIHNGPTGLSLTGLFLLQGFSFKAIVMRSIFCFVMIPIGAVVSFNVLKVFPSNLLGAALAFSGGTFLYISLSDLLPEIHRHAKQRSYAVLGMFGGIIIIVLAKLVFG